MVCGGFCSAGAARKISDEMVRTAALSQPQIEKKHNASASRRQAGSFDIRKRARVTFGLFQPRPNLHIR